MFPRAPALVVGALLGALSLLGCDSSGGADASARDAGPPDAARSASDGGEADAALLSDGSVEADGGALDGGPPDAGLRPPAPAEIFFVGNSFTFGGPVPLLVRDLAVYAGFEEPNVEYRTIGGQTLEGHRADLDPDGAPARVAEGWDAVVLQENSVRPTDRIGPAEQFKEDATWFYDLAKDAREGCEIVLYETWARREGHSIYPDTFTDPAQMQAELRFHYGDAADRYIPEHSRSARPSDVRVAPAGDAWELSLSFGEPPRLHASDDYHAGSAGQYLNALVIYSTLFRRRADGLVPLNGLDEETALLLQQRADTVTGATGYGPLRGAPTPLSAGAEVRFDFGPLWVDGWPAMPERRGTVGPVGTVGGELSSARVTVWGFGGTQEGGAVDNTLGLPGDVSRDTLWLGSFDGHDAALALEGRVVVRGLPEGSYRLELFASRTGDDSGRGRLTRYRIGETFRDLEVANNVGEVAVFDGVGPDARGEILIRVGVSPAGLGRFAYVGALRVVRTDG